MSQKNVVRRRAVGSQRGGTFGRIGGAFVTLLVALVLVVTSAQADLASEVNQGHRLADAIRSNERQCSELSADDFELIGEYAMDRFLGNRATHEAMNQHMVRMMGDAGERRMHITLGYRYTGCTGAPPSSWLGPMAGMMGGYRGGYPGGTGPGMMGRPGGAGGYNGPMMGGPRGPLGSSGENDLSGLAIAALAFGAAVLGGLLVAFVLHLRARRPGATG